MITKKFNKTFDDALTQAYLFHSGLVVDLSHFTAFSPIFDAPYAADFLALITDAASLPTNDEDLNNQVVYSLNVESKMEESRAFYKVLISYVNLKWGDSEVVLRTFGNNLYEKARKVPPRLVNLLELAYRAANSTEYKTDLIAVGFVQADITKLLTLAGELNVLYNDQQEFIQKSSKRSEERIIAFNKFWDEMVKINNASKIVFKDSPASIEYYLLYPESASPGALTAPTGLSFTISNMKISWNSVTNATSYIAELSTDGGITFEEVFTGVENYFIYQPSVEGTVIIKVMGNNANGHGPESTLTFNYYSVLPTVENVEISLVSGSSSMYQLVWNPVLSATAYKIYKSEVAIGNPAGEYTHVTDVTGTVYSGNAVSGKRSWFVLKASNAAQMSSFSEAVYLDVNGTI